MVNLLNLEQGEEIRSILPTSKESQIKHLIMATRDGLIKKTKNSEFDNLRASGLIAIKLRGEDQLVSVHPTMGEDHIILLSKNAKSIRFPEANVRPMGRATTGVTGIKLEKTDEVIGMEVFPAKEKFPSDKRRKYFRDILTIAEKGLGKRTPIHPPSPRAGRRETSRAPMSSGRATARRATSRCWRATCAPTRASAACASWRAHVTERVHGERERASQRERQRLAARLARVGLWEWDVDSRTMIADDSVRALLRQHEGQTWQGPEDFVGRFVPEYRARHAAAMQTAMSGAEPSDCTARLALPDGAVRRLYLYGQRMTSAQGQPRVLGLARFV